MDLKRWDLMDEHELKLMALRCFLKGLVYSIVGALFLFFITKSSLICEFAFIGIVFTITYFSILIYKRDWLDEKIGLFDPYLQGISYQGAVILLSSGIFMASFIFSSTAFIKGNIYSAIAFAFGVNFPIVFMLLRLNVYNNDSRLLYVGKLDGMDHYEQVLGYFPIFYYVLAFPFGMGPLSVSFRRFLESIFLHNGSLEYYSACFILSLLAVSFVLSPDIANNVLPFEIKTFDGLKKFIVISLILLGICLIPLM
ncbi:MAG: hypothetical protein IJI42_00150 [Methanobrevibacter sp.]|nr:hypothetical protein [Methanobrevibacter sp.]